MRGFITTALIGALVTFVAGARAWQPDALLGPRYITTTIDQPDDYSGRVVSTVIKSAARPCPDAKAAILYVHGFNDYFFQDSLAQYFDSHCIPFYAVDLRKYGRSYRPGQQLFHVRDMREYYADIDSALAVLAEDGYRDVILMGHSTGGLTTSLYMSERRPSQVKALILNSPFLDWNLSPALERLGVPAVSAMAPLLGGKKINTGSSPRYFESLRPYADMDTTLKLPAGAKVDARWMRAIDNAHADIQNHTGRIQVPVLLMHSAESAHDGDPDEKFDRADAVLDVDDIRRYGRTLGPDVTEFTVHGGLHDLYTGPSTVTHPLMDKTLDWLHRRGF